MWALVGIPKVVVVGIPGCILGCPFGWCVWTWYTVYTDIPDRVVGCAYMGSCSVGNRRYQGIVPCITMLVLTLHTLFWWMSDTGYMITIHGWT